MMLASLYRLKNSKRIEEVKSKGKLFHSENFAVVALIRQVADVPRLSFIVSTKVSKLAVHRNRIDRALNEGIRRIISRLPKNYDFVVLTKKSIATRTVEEILSEVESFFSKTKFI